MTRALALSLVPLACIVVRERPTSVTYEGPVCITGPGYDVKVSQERGTYKVHRMACGQAEEIGVLETRVVPEDGGAK